MDKKRAGKPGSFFCLLDFNFLKLWNQGALELAFVA